MEFGLIDTGRVCCDHELAYRDAEMTQQPNSTIQGTLHFKMKTNQEQNLASSKLNLELQLVSNDFLVGNMQATAYVLRFPILHHPIHLGKLQ